ncbi:MAG: DUF3426 domain-containing protein [Xanthomonadaceae bacterium]|nr:DUF3426 domain-containing protein [Xanthomonadaceae bacterium]
MFINCPYCKALVATDPVTDLPPHHCPHCDSLLRRDPEFMDDVADPAPMDLGTLMDPRAIAAAEAEAEAEAAARAAAQVQTPRAEAARADSERVDVVRADAEEIEPIRFESLWGEPTSTATAVADDAHAEATDDANDAARASRDERATPAAIAVAPGGSMRRLPSFARSADGSARPVRERWLIIAVIALAFLLVLQLLLADRARLAANAQWRPLLATLCAALRCELPPWREPSAFTLLQRDVRQHPSQPGALRVSATFRNDARWPQPWPRLQLTLSDVNGRPAGQRRFEAQEYLGGAPGQAELASGESATVAMDILEPAPQIVAYDFRFR